MAAFQAWMAQWRSLWGRWSTGQRIALAASTLLCLSAVIGVGYWSSQSQYVPLADRLSPVEAAEMVAALEANAIASRLNFSGSSVLVPRQDLSRARLAAGELLVRDDEGTEDLESSVWSDPDLHHARLLRRQEQRLARSIEQFRIVKSATVHLSLPEPSPFVRDQSPATASVVLELRPGALATRQDAAAIVSLVAHGVEGLDPAQVSVLDTQGRLLNDSDAVEGDIAQQLEFRRRMEADLAAKAETLLGEMLGPGRAAVRVTVDVDFTETHREKTVYDPEGKVKLTETVKSESYNGTTPPRTGGAPGTATNLATAAPPLSAGPTTKIEENTTEYANAETRDTVREAPGRLKRLTVAAIVQLPQPDSAGAAGAAAGPAPSQADVEALIKQAVGFDTERNDQIQLIAAPLMGAVPDDLAVPATPWQDYERLVRSASLGLAAIVAAIFGWLVLRRMRPVVVAGAVRREDAADDRLATLAMTARENPEVIARALGAWMTQSQSGGRPDALGPAAARPAAGAEGARKAA